MLETGSGPRQVYLTGLEAGVIAFQRCRGCAAAVFYPRAICPRCWSSDLEWRTSAGDGVVYSATTIHHRDRDPYTVALVDLSDGIRIACRLDGFPLDDLGTLGRRVVVEVSRLDEVPAPVARPATPHG